MANTVLLEGRSYRPFKSSEEYLYAMREDLAEWLNTLYPDLRINVDNFMDRLDTGVVLCKHANNVRQAAEEYLIRRQARKSMTKSMTSGLAGPILAMGNVHFLPAAKSGTFFARDNVSNFITWCRKSLQIFECLLFETDDLIMRKNEKHVILCLLEVARRGAKFGMLAPMLVQMERQIDREIAADNKANCIDISAQTDNNNMNQSIALSVEDNMYDSDSDDESEVAQTMLVYGPQPQVVTNDLRSLDEMVRELVANCTCPSQFPMVRLSGGKYRIGDTKVLIFVRILRSHVMVRVGGGWDTLSHYLDKHDPCRCRSQHRSAVGARLVTRTNQANNGIELNKAQVHYDRSPQQSKAKAVNFSADTPKSPINGVPSNVETRNQSPTHSKIDEQIPSPISRRSLSPYQQQRIDPKTKNRNSGTNINALINEIESIKWLDDDTSTATGQNSTSSNEVDSKYENASDNGSEISDEGYRSLGLTQQANGSSCKQLTANEKTQCNPESDVKMEATSNEDSRNVTAEHSPIEPLHNDQHIQFDSNTPISMKKSNSIIEINSQKKYQSPSRIPRSPIPRRRSIDSSSPNANNASPTTGLPLFSRKIPTYRSMRKSTESASTSVSNTGAMSPLKKIGTPKLMRKHTSADEPDSIEKIPKNKMINNIQQNIRIIKPNKHLSPKKLMTSPLARQIWEVTESAENDAQILEQMKQLLSKYKMSSPLKYPSNRQPSNATQFDDNDAMEFNSLNLYQPPENSLRKTRSNSVISSRDNIAFGKGEILMGNRSVRGSTTRIPTPIRQNTELY